jgi:hypothetical protein
VLEPFNVNDAARRAVARTEEGEDEQRPSQVDGAGARDARRNPIGQHRQTE